MLFNSPEFIFLFLPSVLLGFYFSARSKNKSLAIIWLVLASLFFYGWWKIEYLFLIISSIIFNFIFGILLGKYHYKKLFLIIGIAVNLGLLGYFKYANFFLDNFNAITGNNFYMEKIILPLAISFFTFQQITYLVDIYRGKTKEYSFVHYCLFVTFFPQLIAGPIVHHKEMLPQFTKKSTYEFLAENMAIGLSIFIIGLFKKVVLADSIAIFSTPIFDAAETGANLAFIEAWIGTFAYTFQLYFDFSGYSDMAIGAARMFGIILPLNFHSPYKSRNIIEFWRKWHITLSRFLKDYLYIPLGGNQKGKMRRYINLMITMLLGGLWHGAGWTFVIWGALHGFYLIINNLWHIFCTSHKITLGKFISSLLTFTSVAVAWVFFRAESMNGATTMLSAMISGKTTFVVLDTIGVCLAISLITILSIIVFTFPNAQEIMKNHNPAINAIVDEKQNLSFLWKPDSYNALLFAALSFMAILTMFLNQESEFLYFQF